MKTKTGNKKLVFSNSFHETTATAIGVLHEELAKSRAERNEYFVALSKIANNPVYGVEVIELVTIAKAALRRNGE